MQKNIELIPIYLAESHTDMPVSLCDPAIQSTGEREAHARGRIYDDQNTS